MYWTSGFIFKLTFVTIVIYQSCNGAKVVPVCHFSLIDNCFRPFFYFSHRENGTGIPITLKEFNYFCSGMGKSVKCIENYMNSCSSGVIQEIWLMIKSEWIHSLIKICSNNSIKKNFIKHASCIQKVKLVKHYKITCIRELQAGLEMMEEKKDEDWIETGCCAYTKWFNCLQNQINDECGNNAVEAIVTFLHYVTAGVFDNICPKYKYDHESEYCRKNLPPKSREPLGRYSNAIFSKYFTLFCPKVGY